MASKDLHPLGEMILDAIEELGIKQVVVAQRMGISRQRVAQLRTKKSFDLELLQKIKDATGLDYTGYVFNPKNKKYEEAKFESIVAEPIPINNSNRVEVSLTLRINAQESDFSKIGALMNDLKEQAGKHGFQII